MHKATIESGRQLTISVKFEVNDIPNLVIIQKVFNSFTCETDDVNKQNLNSGLFQELLPFRCHLLLCAPQSLEFFVVDYGV